MKVYNAVLLVGAIAWLGGCIFPPGTTIPKEPTPELTPTVTARPTLPPAIPPYDIPTPDATPFEIINLPEAVFVDDEFLIIVRTAKLDEVNVLVDKIQVGKMQFDKQQINKELRVKLKTAGERTISFRVNGVVIHSQPLTVLESK